MAGTIIRSVVVARRVEHRLLIARRHRGPSGAAARLGLKRTLGLVRFNSVLGHQPFIHNLNRPQVAEGRCGCGGSNKAISVERNSLGKEQLLEPLALFERRLHPEVSGAR
jgi:hypothetical protein